MSAITETNTMTHNAESGNCNSLKTRARFLSRTRSKLRLCSANHRTGYFSNLVCGWQSIVWAYSKHESENGPRYQQIMSMGTRAPFQYPIRRLTVRSRKVSKTRDLYLELPDRSEIWQAPRQQSCRSACQISKRCDNLNYQSRGFETSRDLTIRRLIGYWNGAQIFKWEALNSQGL